MKIRELIDLLSEFDPEMEVLVMDPRTDVAYPPQPFVVADTTAGTKSLMFVPPDELPRSHPEKP